MSEILFTLADNDLIESLKQLVRKEREVTHEVIRHLAEVDRRRLYAELGYPSLFDYAVRGLGYSRMSAQRRIVAARTIRQVPEAYDLIKRNELSLAACEVVAAAMNAQNAGEIVKEVAGKSVEDARVVAARFRPVSKKAAKDCVAPIFVGAKANEGQVSLFASSGHSRTGVTDVQFRMSFTASAELKRKLDRVQELVSSSPDVSLAQVLDDVLEFYLKHRSPEGRQKRREERKNRRVMKAAPRTSDRLTESCRDRILERDGFQCTFVAPDGVRCECRRNLEIDHVIPKAHGGDSSDENLRVLCKTHNLMFARKYLGSGFMARWMATPVRE